MRIKNILLGFAVAATLAACGGNDYSPKPQAYLRLDTPGHKYTLVDTLPFSPDSVRVSSVALPFRFEVSENAELTLKKKTPREMWVDIKYPQWDGVVFLTYKRLRTPDDLRGQTDTSTRFLEEHYQLASGIDEQAFESDDHTVHAVKWHLKGKKVASTYQFFATDSAQHYLRGALFINHVPNNDSLAPFLEYMQRDIDHLIETLRWR